MSCFLARVASGALTSRIYPFLVPADVVLGQVDFTTNAPNDADGDGSEDASPAATTLNFPEGIFVEGNKLIVADNNNDRYLIYEGL